MKAHIEVYEIKDAGVPTFPAAADDGAAEPREKFSWHPTNAEEGDRFFQQEILVATIAQSR